jgi:hypothetical protein
MMQIPTLKLTVYWLVACVRSVKETRAYYRPVSLRNGDMKSCKLGALGLCPGHFNNNMSSLGRTLHGILILCAVVRQVLEFKVCVKSVCLRKFDQ